MVKLRLIRTGRRNDPHFRIVAQDERRAPKGAYLELLGSWSPVQKQKVLYKEKILSWISNGAKPTDTVWNMLVSEKIVEGKKIPVHAKAKKKKGEEGEKQEVKEEPKAEEKKE